MSHRLRIDIRPFAFGLLATFAQASDLNAEQPLVEAPGPATPIYVIAHIDVMPPYTADAKNALVSYVRAARVEAGANRIEAAQEVVQNHFDLIEVWHDQTSYRSHLSSQAWLQLRGAVSAWLGSPINERIGSDLTP